jgi:hypothetical protein
MTELRALQQISQTCPAQWTAEVGNQGGAYIRYRHGCLEAHVSTVSREGLDGTVVYEEQIGTRYDGEMSTDDMRHYLADVFTFED